MTHFERGCTHYYLAAAARGAITAVGQTPTIGQRRPRRHDSRRSRSPATHKDVEQRLTSGGRYAANLMFAIGNGMLVIDQDEDDRVCVAITALASSVSTSRRAPGVSRLPRHRLTSFARRCELSRRTSTRENLSTQ